MTVNTKKNLHIEVNNIKYQRIPIKTHIIQIKEPLIPIIEKYAKPVYKPGDLMVITSKILALSQNRAIHESKIKPGLLAKLITKGVSKPNPKDDPLGDWNEKKMQVAINEAGFLRMLLAMLIGGITRFFGRKGDFYRIAGHNISRIDGLIEPNSFFYKEYAILSPINCDEIAEEIEKNLNIPVAFADCCDRSIDILGASKNLPLNKEIIAKIMKDNPAGQDDETTPIVLIRKQN